MDGRARSSQQTVEGNKTKILHGSKLWRQGDLVLAALVCESHADKRFFPPYDLRLARYFVEIHFEDIGYMNISWKKQTRTC